MNTYVGTFFHMNAKVHTCTQTQLHISRYSHTWHDTDTNSQKPTFIQKGMCKCIHIYIHMIIQMHMIHRNLRRKEFISLYCLWSVTQESQRKSSRQESGGRNSYRGIRVLLPGLFPMVCLTCFFIPPRTYLSRMALPTVSRSGQSVTIKQENAP